MSALRRLCATVVALLTVLAAPLAAQPPDTREDRLFDFGRLESEIRFHGFVFDNFFQAPEGRPEEEVSLSRVEGRLAFDLSPEQRWRAYARGRYDAYSDGLDEAWAGGGGVRYEGEVHELDLYGELERDRPEFEVGDEFDRADQLRLAGEYAWRLTDAWQVSALADFRDQEFDRSPAKDNEMLSVGGALRFRGWGYDFSPEVGAEWGSRDAVSADEDHDQRDLWIKLRSVPFRSLYLSLRYRYRTRDYAVTDPAASNFAREDERRQWVLAADYRIREWISANGYWSYEDADSTKESRVFESQLIGLGLALHF